MRPASRRGPIGADPARARPCTGACRARPGAMGSHPFGMKGRSVSRRAAEHTEEGSDEGCSNLGVLGVSA